MLIANVPGAKRIQNLYYLMRNPMFLCVVSLTVIPNRTNAASAVKQFVSSCHKALIERDPKIVIKLVQYIIYGCKVIFTLHCV